MGIANLHYKLYYDETYSVGRDAIINYMKTHWGTTFDENYNANEGHIKWSLPSGEFVWGASAYYRPSMGAKPEGDVYVKLSSDKAKEAVPWSTMVDG